jgi:hypothetical protein
VTDVNVDPNAAPPEGEAQPPPDDGTTVTIPAPAQPTSGNRNQRVGTEPPQAFTTEDVERIRQEERARVQAEQARADGLENELAQFRKAEEDRAKAEQSAQRAADREKKKKDEEEMELRDLIQKKDQEWEERLQAERQEREKAFAMLEQERRHASLQTYLAQRMADEGDKIVPILRDLVAGNSTEEIDASIAMLVEKSEHMKNDSVAAMRNINAGRPMAGVTAPPVGPMESSQASRTLTAGEIKDLTPEEYAQDREALLRAASESRRAQQR